MKPKFVSVAVVCLLFVVLSLTWQPSLRPSAQRIPQAHAEAAHAVCNAQLIEGKYALFGQGSLTQPFGPLPIGPFSVVGLVVFDGDGHLSGSETDHFNGSVVIAPTFTGTYAVDSSCAISATIDASIGAQFHVVGVIADRGKEIELATLDQGVSDLRRAKRQE